ncbi:MAG: HlyD family efflux transporter periplasmic adaptor subunit [Methylococcales bacterium]|nr:HlyD family efflux transporter periplasmic adaptor subunit [Methylococcales bacterium]MDP3839554.1 HlyD family efflux transporter periplasmic adaptor subunit [Methylococcales bacterium]
MKNQPALHLLELDALVQAKTTPLVGRLARYLSILFVVLIIFLLLTPWQQNVRGIGRVVAYAPAERQQMISAPVEGRVKQFLVKEGSQVKQGDILVELLDNDPLLLQRLSGEQQALLTKQRAIDSRVETFREQLRMTEQARPQALTAAASRINMANERYKAAVQSVDAAQAAKKTANLNLSRQQQLQAKGLASQRTLELSTLEMAQRYAEVERAQAGLQAAKSEVDALSADRQKLTADTAGGIEKAKSELNKALEDQSVILADLLKLETKLARQQTQVITAPRDGTILRLLANPNAELVKAGQALAILIPDVEQRAVELWVDGNDLPLIINDSHVRLQFEGYPAIQFGGWPEFSIGSFAGKVTLIDSTDDGKGNFRVLVTALVEDGIDWPSPRFLRQGVRVNGWVLLGQVTLGYELWRIFNGFPPLVLPESNPIEKTKGDSKSDDKNKTQDSSEKKDK